MSVSKRIIKCIRLVDSQRAPSVLSYLKTVNYYKAKPGEATEDEYASIQGTNG